MHQLSATPAWRWLLPVWWMVLLCCPPGWAASAVFTVDLAERSSGVLHITTQVASLPVGDFWVRFPVDAAMSGHPELIKDFTVYQSTGEPVAAHRIGPGLYSLSTTGPSDLIFHYIIDPRFAGWDYQYPTIDTTHVQLPVQNTVFAVYEADSANSGLSGREKSNLLSSWLRFKDMPAAWQIHTQCPMEAGNVKVDTGNCFVGAGDYQIRHLRLGNADFTLAVDVQLGFDHTLMWTLESVLREQYSVYDGYNLPQAAVMITRMPDYAQVLESGGFALPGMAVYYARPVSSTDQTISARLLFGITHEIVHLWLAEGFHQYEGMLWFTEGFASYQALQTLLRLGLLDESTYLDMLARQYVAATQAERYAPVSLRVAGATRSERPGYHELVYNKGTFVAYLFNQALQQTSMPGHDFDSFLRSLYREYALSGKPIGNLEVITSINQDLGDPYFMQKWVLEPTALASVKLPELHPYLQAAWLAALPDIAINLWQHAAPVKAWGFCIGIVLATWYGVQPGRSGRRWHRKGGRNCR